MKTFCHDKSWLCIELSLFYTLQSHNPWPEVVALWRDDDPTAGLGTAVTAAPVDGQLRVHQGRRYPVDRLHGPQPQHIVLGLLDNLIQHALTGISNLK